MNKVSIILLALFLPVIIILCSANYWMFNSGFYYKEYESGAYKTLGVNYSNQEINSVTDQLLLYLKGVSQFPDSFFTKDEAAHMEDVKALVSKCFFLLNSSIAIASIIVASIIAYCFLTERKVWFSYFLKHLGVAFTFGAILTLFIGGFSFIGFENFSETFTGFHTIFFKQGNWEFPAGSHLIMLFPETFFLNIAELIMITALSISVICLLSGILLSRYGPLWEKQNN